MNNFQKAGKVWDHSVEDIDWHIVIKDYKSPQAVEI